MTTFFNLPALQAQTPKPHPQTEKRLSQTFIVTLLYGTLWTPVYLS